MESTDLDFEEEPAALVAGMTARDRLESLHKERQKVQNLLDTRYRSGSEKYERAQLRLLKIDRQIGLTRVDVQKEAKAEKRRAEEERIRQEESTTPEDEARWKFLLDPKKCSIRKFLHGAPEVDWPGFLIDTKESPADGDGTNTVLWRPWPGQDRIVGMADDFLHEKALVLHILKDREQGCSKEIQGIMFERFMRAGGGEGRTVAQDDRTTLNLQWDFKSLRNQTPKFVWKMLGVKWEADADGKWDILWPGGARRSKMETMTCRSDAFGRGSRLRFFHTSEYPWWPDRARPNLSNLLTTINRGRGNIYVNESTGRGEDEFKTLCENARDEVSLDKCEFLSWLTHPKKTYSFPDADARADFVETIGRKVEYEPKKELELVDLGATPEQLHWRRLQIAGTFFGNAAIFSREHPAVWDDAFMADSDCYFDLSILRSWRDLAKKDEGTTPRGDFGFGNNGSNLAFEEKANGPWRMIRPPQRGKSYSFGADPSSGRKFTSDGRKEADYAVIVVWEYETDDVVAIFRDHITPEDLATQVVAASKHYGWCSGYVEANNDGRGCLPRIRDLEAMWGAPDAIVLPQERVVATKSGETVQHYEGFVTDSKTKPQAANYMRRWLRALGKAKADEPRSRIPWVLLREMFKYEQVSGDAKSGPRNAPIHQTTVRLGASSGFDDVVSAAMIGRAALEWLRVEPDRLRKVEGTSVDVTRLTPRQIHEARVREQERVKREPIVLYHPFGESPVEIQRKKNHAIDAELGAMF